MKNDILPQVSSQFYSFGCNEADFSDIPLQMENELNIDFSMDSNLYSTEENIGQVLAFCSDSQFTYQSEATSVMNVKRLGCPELDFDHSFSMPAYENEVHITKKPRNRSADNAETMAQIAGENTVMIGGNIVPDGQLNQQQAEETNTRIRMGKKAPARRSQKLSDKITALQKLVSPYGKTDTASVLREAYISIKSLQDQIQNLCNESCDQSDEKTGDENGAGMFGIGLCLVPISLSQKVLADMDLFSQMLEGMSCFTA